MAEFDINESGWIYIEEVASHQVGEVLDEVYSDARLTVPRDKGDLGNSLQKRFTPGDLEGKVRVGTDHWAPTEYGSRPHIIRVKTKKVLSDGTNFFGKEVNHPGTPSQPFMRSSLFKKRQLRKGFNG